MVCSECGCRIVTRESIVRWSYPTPTEAKATVERLKEAAKRRKFS